MAAVRFISEPYQLSARFYRAMQIKALSLEIDAVRDELAASTLDHPDHVRRQHLLIQAQRDEAERLRDFLARATVREEG